jgi:hypothetical protein
LENITAEKYQIFYLAQPRIFIIRIFGIPDEQDIVKCFQDYERNVEANFDHQKFSFIINVTEEAHSGIMVLRMIRSFLENQKYRHFIKKIAAINENKNKVDFRNSQTASDILRFFSKEEDAIEYIKT